MSLIGFVLHITKSQINSKPVSKPIMCACAHLFVYFKIAHCKLIFISKLHNTCYTGPVLNSRKKIYIHNLRNVVILLHTHVHYYPFKEISNAPWNAST
jgi:hypothetical protein